MIRPSCFFVRRGPSFLAFSLHSTTIERQAVNNMRRGGGYSGRSVGRGGGRGDYYKNKYGGGGRGGRGRGGYNVGRGSAANDSDANKSSSDPTAESAPRAYDPNVPRPGGDNGGMHADFINLLRRLDHKQYPAYHDIESSSKGWVNDMEGYTLYIGRAQSDPFAKPTRCRIVVKNETAKFPPLSYQNKVRSVALGDFLNRKFYECCKEMGADVSEGSGQGGGWSGPKGGDIDVSMTCFFAVILTPTVAIHNSCHFCTTLLKDYETNTACHRTKCCDHS